MSTTRIVKEISANEFKELLTKYKHNIKMNPHALDHLSNAQRKLMDENELTDAVLKEKPSGIGLQQNGRYALFFKRKYGFLRIILEEKTEKFEIITFINTETMPNLKRLEHGE